MIYKKPKLWQTLKEIRKRIVSVQNTQKITRAMTMISASKLHRARLDIENSRYYNQTLKEMVLSLQQKAAEYLEAFLANLRTNRGKFNRNSRVFYFQFR